MAEARVFPDPEALGAALAADVAERVDGRAFVLGCPGGRSLLTTYRALARTGADFSRLVVVMMDEYLPVPPTDAPHSSRGFAERELVGPHGLRGDQVWLPDPERPYEYDERIARARGIDLFLLASGASDGHVAFIAPGSDPDAGTAVVALAETTRADNRATFPELKDVPREGVSVGLGTIRKARALRLVLHGREKRAAAARLLERDQVDPEWPATIVHDHDDAEIWLDEAARP
jgi:glucosamine-6-phosphate deaminase